MAMRAGVKPNFPQQVGFVKSAVAFGRLADAQAYLRDELRGAGLIVAAENLRPLQRFPHAPGPPLIDGYQCPANEVDFFGAFNYRSMLGTPQNWYWEHASGPWRDGGKVLHDQSQFKKHVVFIVLPNAPSRSPIVPSMLHNGSEASR